MTLPWKRAAKRWRKAYRHERDVRWREKEAVRRAGVSVMLAWASFDRERGDRTTIFTESTERLAPQEPE